MAYHQYNGDKGGDGYAFVVGLLFVLFILFVFGMAIGLGISVSM